MCVVKPDEFWDKKVTHFCFWKEKDRLGFEACIQILCFFFYHSVPFHISISLRLSDILFKNEGETILFAKTRLPVIIEFELLSMMERVASDILLSS